MRRTTPGLRRRPRARLSVLAILSALAGCLIAPAPAPTERAEDRLSASPLRAALGAREPVVEPVSVTVIVTLDGVRWQEVFRGVEPALAERAGMREREVVGAPELMPNLHWLVRTRGAAVGAPGSGRIDASGPSFVSLPGYREIFTGRRGDPCHSNDCARVAEPTLADDLAQDGDLGEVAVFASWPTVAKAATDGGSPVLVSAGRGKASHDEPLAQDQELAGLKRRGDQAAPAPGYGSYRPDAYTAALAIGYLRRHQPRLLFVGLGDTDEHAHHDDYRHYLAALRHADGVIGEIAVHLASLSAAGTTTALIVTADHGRAAHFADHGARWPESSRVWLVAVGDAISSRGTVASPEPRSLADANATLRRLVGLPPSGDGQLLAELFAPPSRALATR